MRDVDFNEMVDVYITAHFILLDRGSPEVQRCARLLLDALDREIRQRKASTYDEVATWIECDLSTVQ